MKLKNVQGWKALVANLRLNFDTLAECHLQDFTFFFYTTLWLHHSQHDNETVSSKHVYHQATQIPVKQLTLRICTMRLSLEHKTSICLSSIPYQENIES